MATYTEMTETVAEQWENALKQVHDVQAAVLSPWVRTASRIVPDVDVPFADRLPSQKDVVDANFRLAERTIQAQRNYVHSLYEVATPAAETVESDSEKSTSSSGGSSKK